MLSVIIVNFNTAFLVEKCVESIKKYPPSDNYEIIVVDNNSSESEKEKLKHLDAKVIFSEENYGFSKANNTGVDESLGDTLLFLNPDTEVKEDTLNRCLHFLKENKDAGAVGVKVSLPDGKLDYACKRSLPTLRNTIGHYLKLNGKIKYFSGYRRLDLPDDYVGEIECIVGAFMMMPREIFFEAGRFSEDYFMYAEDVELCKMILEKGYKIYYLGDREIIHYKRASSRNSGKAKKAFYDSMEIYSDKHTKNPLAKKLIKLGIKILRITGV